MRGLRSGTRTSTKRSHSCTRHPICRNRWVCFFVSPPRVKNVALCCAALCFAAFSIPTGPARAIVRDHLGTPGNMRASLRVAPLRAVWRKWIILCPAHAVAAGQLNCESAPTEAPGAPPTSSVALREKARWRATIFARTRLAPSPVRKNFSTAAILPPGGAARGGFDDADLVVAQPSVFGRKASRA
jgi:hypothetical protein